MGVREGLRGGHPSQHGAVRPEGGVCPGLWLAWRGLVERDGSQVREGWEDYVRSWNP